jgi:peptide-methionine (S)-S-oxide reductase
MTFLGRLGILSIVFIAAACAVSGAASSSSTALPAPAVDDALAAPGTGFRKAVVAGGCFWGIEAVYRHVRGVEAAVSGYAGGTANTARYEIIGTGRTGHAESVEVTYDPSKITYGTVLRIFFSVAHDPTELNRQGPDDGPQYRSAIFFSDEEQARIARAYVAQLGQAGAFKRKIVTEITKLPAFYAAEDYHQNYAALHPYEPYIMINDAPKVSNLKKAFPDLYVGK